jgi:DtxR family Mn-dependent transcriptional regulator
MLEILSHYKITIGSKLKISKKFLFDNSVEVKLNNQPATILSEQVAKYIFVYDNR